MSKETLFVAEINDRVVNFTSIVRAVFISKNQAVADILNYYLCASLIRPDLRQAPQRLAQFNTESGFPSNIYVSKQITQVETGGKRYLVFETQQARDDVISLGLIEEDSSDDQIIDQIKEYFEPAITKVSDWLGEVSLEDSIKALRLGLRSNLRRIIQFIGKESPDSTGLIRSPQKRQVRAFLSSLQNLIQYPFGSLSLV